MSIKLLNATVDIFTIAPGTETIIIRGIISPESLAEIRVAKYQREAIPGAKMNSLKQAFKTSTVPDIELGMRGERYRVNESKESSGDIFHLQDDTFVIDGLQRITAAKAVIAEDSQIQPRIGAVIHVNTTEGWEAERFRILNQDRLKLNGNILLRNARPKSPAVDMLYLLTEDPSFVLHNRVQWSQRKARTELTTALILCQVAGFLHSRFGPGRGSDINMIGGLDKIMEEVGRTTMRDNVKTFFDVLEEHFGIHRIVYGHSATVLRFAFLISMAELFTQHTNFWRGKRLFIERPLRVKIGKFPINDPEVVRLASSGGKAREILYMFIRDHVNSGKRTRKLIPIGSAVPEPTQIEPVEELEMAGAGR